MNITRRAKRKQDRPSPSHVESGSERERKWEKGRGRWRARARARETETGRKRGLWRRIEDAIARQTSVSKPGRLRTVAGADEKRVFDTRGRTAGVAGRGFAGFGEEIATQVGSCIHGRGGRGSRGGGGGGSRGGGRRIVMHMAMEMEKAHLEMDVEMEEKEKEKKKRQMAKEGEKKQY